MSRDCDLLDRSIISSKAVPHACSLLEKFGVKIERLVSTDQKVYLIENYEPFPEQKVVDNTNSNYRDLNAVNLLLATRSTIS